MMESTQSDAAVEHEEKTQEPAASTRPAASTTRRPRPQSVPARLHPIGSTSEPRRRSLVAGVWSDVMHERSENPESVRQGCCKLGYRAEEEAARTLFTLIDSNMDGSLTEDDIRTLVFDFGFDTSVYEHVIRTMTVDANGNVTEDAFVEFVLSVKRASTFISDEYKVLHLRRSEASQGSLSHLTSFRHVGLGAINDTQSSIAGFASAPRPHAANASNGRIDFRTEVAIENFGERVVHVVYILELQLHPHLHISTLLLVFGGVRPMCGKSAREVLRARRKRRRERADGGSSSAALETYSEEDEDTDDAIAMRSRTAAHVAALCNDVQIATITILSIVGGIGAAVTTLILMVLRGIWRVDSQSVLNGKSYDTCTTFEIFDDALTIASSFDTVIYFITITISINVIAHLLGSPLSGYSGLKRTCQQHRGERCGAESEAHHDSQFSEWADLAAALHSSSSHGRPKGGGCFTSMSPNRMAMCTTAAACAFALIEFCAYAVLTIYSTVSVHSYTRSFCVLNVTGCGLDAVPVGTAVQASMLKAISQCSRILLPLGVLSQAIASPLLWGNFVVVTTAASAVAMQTKKAKTKMVRVLNELRRILASRMPNVSEDAATVSSSESNSATSRKDEVEKEKVTVVSLLDELQHIERSCRLDAFGLDKPRWQELISLSVFSDAISVLPYIGLATLMFYRTSSPCSWGDQTAKGLRTVFYLVGALMIGAFRLVILLVEAHLLAGPAKHFKRLADDVGDAAADVDLLFRVWGAIDEDRLPIVEGFARYQMRLEKDETLAARHAFKVCGVPLDRAFLRAIGRFALILATGVPIAFAATNLLKGETGLLEE